VVSRYERIIFLPLWHAETSVYARFGVGTSCGMPPTFFYHTKVLSRFLKHIGLTQENHAVAKMTARCAQYMSAVKIACKRKISRQLRKNRHITILSLFGGEIIFEVFQPMLSGYLNVTDGQTDGQYTVASPRGKTWETKCRRYRYYRYRRYLKTDIDNH